jgi:hypothetical protein
MKRVGWWGLITVTMTLPASGVNPPAKLPDALSQWQSDYGSAKLTARRENKPILVVFR